MRPQFGDLKTAEGGFVTKLGKFRAKWEVVDGGYWIDVETPRGTEGELVLPLMKEGVFPSFVMNGKRQESSAVKIEGRSMRMIVVGGEYRIEVSE